MNQKAQEELEKLPDGIYSGHKEDARGIFFYYQYGEDFHYWYFCDLENNEIIENKSEILDIISVDENKERKIPEELFDRVYKQSDKVRGEIETDYKDIQQSSTDDKRSKWDNDHSKKFLIRLDDVLKQNLRQHLRKYPDDREAEEQINEIQEKLRKITMTKRRTSDIRSFWRAYKDKNGHGDWKKLADNLEDYLENYTPSNENHLGEFDEDKLKLVSVEFVS